MVLSEEKRKAKRESEMIFLAAKNAKTIDASTAVPDRQNCTFKVDSRIYSNNFIKCTHINRNPSRHTLCLKS